MMIWRALQIHGCQQFSWSLLEIFPTLESFLTLQISPVINMGFIKMYIDLYPFFLAFAQEIHQIFHLPTTSLGSPTYPQTKTCVKFSYLFHSLPLHPFTSPDAESHYEHAELVSGCGKPTQLNITAPF